MARSIGAQYLGDGRCHFAVWAPLKKAMVLHIVSPFERKLSLKKDKFGYFTGEVDDVPPGTKYFLMPDGQKDLPDPASYYQPEGVHGPSAVVDHNAYDWHDQNCRSATLDELILYELHVGTFTQEGTFEAIIPRLNDLADTGINAIELMPIAQFPGDRNWGYDGVCAYAVQNSYGGPEGLKKLVDACHLRGISVYLDVVYNHLGPEGNYMPQFAPYFTHRYNTPWGDAINFDGEHADGVRNYFCNNALYWMRHFHIDGLRFDAIHQMYDFGAIHFWNLLHESLKHEEQKHGKHFYLIAESDLNNPKVIKHPGAGGYGFDAQWLDDFHHSLYVLLYPKGQYRYIDFGKIEQLAKAYTDGFVHSGEYVSFRKRRHGAPSIGIPGYRFITFLQNHDQVGNTADGSRLCTQLSFDLTKVGAAAVLLSPYLPMLFMGEEYGEDKQFTYFVSHSDKELIEAVKNGRKKEFEHEQWAQEPPDPQSEETFNRCKLDWRKRDEGKHKVLLQWYKDLIGLRKTNPALKNFNKNDVRVYIVSPQAYVLHRRSADEQDHILALINLSEYETSFTMPSFAETWQPLLSSLNYSEPDQQRIQESAKPLSAGKEVTIPPHSALIYTNRPEIQ